MTQIKPLTSDTQNVVNDLRTMKSGVELVFSTGDGSRPYIAGVLGRAVSQLSLLDVRSERVFDENIVLTSRCKAPRGGNSSVTRGGVPSQRSS